MANENSTPTEQTHQSKWPTFAAMIATSIVTMFVLKYSNVYEAGHIWFSQTRMWMALMMGMALGNQSSIDNNQAEFRSGFASLQASVATLQAENAALKAENAALKKAKEEAEARGACVSCCTYTARWMYEICEHVVFCDECVHRWPGACPICRKDSERVPVRIVNGVQAGDL